MIDLYLDENYSPVFFENEIEKKQGIFLTEKLSETMALRNRIQSEINNQFLASINSPQKMTPEFKRMIENVILIQAQILGVNISFSDLEKIRYETKNKKLIINLNF